MVNTGQQLTGKFQKHPPVDCGALGRSALLIHVGPFRSILQPPFFGDSWHVARVGMDWPMMGAEMARVARVAALAVSRHRTVLRPRRRASSLRLLGGSGHLGQQIGIESRRVSGS